MSFCVPGVAMSGESRSLLGADQRGPAATSQHVSSPRPSSVLLSISTFTFTSTFIAYRNAGVRRLALVVNIFISLHLLPTQPPFRKES